MSTARPSSPLKPGAIARLLPGDHLTASTREALQARLDWVPPEHFRHFSAGQFAVLSAVCDRLIPQQGGRVPLAAMLDDRVANGSTDGWRYDDMPPDRIAFLTGLDGIEATARSLCQASFVALEAGRQDVVLAAVKAGKVAADVWSGLPAPRFFEELLTQLAEIYYAHPHAQERIGYVGMADAKGFHALGLNRRDPIENEASLAAL